MTDQASHDGAPTQPPEFTECPVCGAHSDLAVNQRCPQCSTDLRHPAVAQLAEANRAIAQCQAAYNDVAARWGEWNARHAELMQQLSATRSSAATPPPPTPAAARHAYRSAYEPPAPASASTASAPAPAAAVAQPSAGTTRFSAPSSSVPPVARRTPRRLTAPVLLGIAGAALLITAVVIFVAVTWTTFNPAAQGLLILAVAAALGYCSVVLGRHDLAVSGGAVGVVAVAFAGVSVFAFDRGTGLLGDFASTGALVVASGAGYVLSRLSVRWVHAFAALALVGAGFSAVVTFTLQDVEGHRAWVGVVGAVSAWIVGATHRWWHGAAAPRIVRFGAVVGLTLAASIAFISALPAFDYLPSMSFTDSRAVLTLSLVIPVMVFVLWQRMWPRAVAAPLALVAPFAAGAIVGLAGLPWWVGATAISIAVAALLWWAARWPRGAKDALLAALIPAALVMAYVTLWAAVVSIANVMVVLISGDSVLLDPYLGLATIAGALALVVLRRWELSSTVRTAAEVTAAVIVLCGVLALSSGVATSSFDGQRVPLSLALLVAAAGTLASRWLWAAAQARTLATRAAVALVTTAGVMSAVSVAFDYGEVATGADVPAVEVVGAVALVVAAIVVLILGARWLPHETLPSATFLTTSLVAAIAIAAGSQWGAVIVAAVGAAAAISWLLLLMPHEWRKPARAGLLPAVAVGGTVAAWGAVQSFGVMLDAETSLTPHANYGWMFLTAVLVALVLAALARDPRVTAQDARAAEYVGAASLVAAAMIVTAWTHQLIDSPWGADLAAIAIALALGLTAQWWRASAVRYASRMAAGVVLTAQTLIAIAAMTSVDSSLVWSAAAAAVGVIALIVASARWLPITSGPAVFAATVFVPFVVYAAAAPDEAVTLALAVSVAVGCWAVRGAMLGRGPASARPMAWGLAIPAAVLVALVSIAVIEVLVSYASAVSGDDPAEPVWWVLGTSLATAAGLLAWDPARHHWMWVGLVAVFVSAGAISPVVAFVSLLVLAGALAIAAARSVPWTSAPARTETQWASLIAAIVAIGWGADLPWGVALASAGAAALSWWMAVEGAQSSGGSETAPPLKAELQRADVAVALAVALSAVAAGFTASSLGAAQSLSIIVGVTVAIVGVVVARFNRYESNEGVGISLLALATIFPAMWLGTFTMSGVAVLTAAVGWWAFRLTGWKPGTWVASVVTSVGVGFLLVGAGVGALEAYFATPALCALVIGGWELRSNPQMRTLTALGPGLGLALFPSYFAMLFEPTVALRPLILVVVTLALAVIGVLNRWFAPVLAACVTAVVIALTQVMVTDNPGIRWVAFAVVGAMLLVIAATYEKLKKLR